MKVSFVQVNARFILVFVEFVTAKSLSQRTYSGLHLKSQH
ncbi:UNVERIFIED_ORG: hypothetical protein DFS12_101137 [Chitinophaga ginsengisegetis]|nr:hypothetical protein [Chitinophaga ginsengisegetis]MDR6644895.1 hypothetical protein [Chitinophaga ginsengisegetis]MDR6652513.1 hypothetical protein [Chitinophaga ginsengisegetis]